MEEKVIFNFEKLDAWQKAMDLTVEIYRLTGQFPRSEQFSLTDQIRRAISAVAANLAEGNARKTGKDKAHFTNIAFSNLMETMNHLILAANLAYRRKYITCIPDKNQRNSRYAQCPPGLSTYPPLIY